MRLRSVWVVVPFLSFGHGLRAQLSRRSLSRRDDGLWLQRRADADPGHGTILNNLHDLQYTMNLTIGGLNAEVLVDTGSVDLYVYERAGHIETVNTTTMVTNITYLDKAFVSGPIKQAPVELAGFTIPAQAFLHVNETKNDDTMLSLSGLIGIGMSAQPYESSINNRIFDEYKDLDHFLPSPLHSIFRQDPSLRSFFTMYLSRESSSGGEPGLFTVGEYIDELSSISNSPELPCPLNDSWSALIERFTVGNQSIALNTSSSSIPSGQAIAVLDSGTSLARLPRYLVDAIYGGIPGSIRIEVIPGTYFWLLPCTSMPEVVLTFGATDFPVHPLDLNTVSFETTPDGKKVAMCHGSYQESSDQGWDMLLGAAFLRNAYAVYDYALGENKTTFVQLMPLTNATAAHDEFSVIRKQQLDGFTVLSPSDAADLFHLQAQQSAANHTQDDAGTISGVLAESSSNDEAGSSALESWLRRYTPVVIGLLAGNLAVLLIICVMSVYLCVRKGGRARNVSPSYHPVKVDGKERDPEGFYATRYDP